MAPEHEIKQLRIMLARAWVLLEEINVHGQVQARPLFDQAWVEIREWLSDVEIASVQASYLETCRKTGKNPFPGPAGENPHLSQAQNNA